MLNFEALKPGIKGHADPQVFLDPLVSASEFFITSFYR